MASKEKVPYMLNRDDRESSRLNRQHTVWAQAIGYLIHPEVNGKLLQKPDVHIADVGTGTGVWLKQLAAESPQTYHLHGFDVSDMQFPSTEEEKLPANIQLHVHDAFSPFSNEWQSEFDVVHLRLLVAAMPSKEAWAAVTKNVMELLKPGGMIQWEEANLMQARSVLKGTPSSTTKDYEALAKGYTGFASERLLSFDVLPGVFREAGLENVDVAVVSSDRIPEARREFTKVIEGAASHGLESLTHAKVPGHWPIDKIRELSQKSKKDIETGAYVRSDLHVCIGFKAGEAQ